MYYYQAFGLTIAADIKIPEFLTIPIPNKADVQILESSPSNNSTEENIQQLFITTPTVADFLVINGNSIHYQRHETCDDDNLRLFLLGSAMGGLLQQRGFIVLHGNAVTQDGKTCDIFVGEQGAGKSTTAAWHYCQGSKVLADDVCAIYFSENGEPYVIPSYPQIKLWQASADLLNISTNNLRRLRKSFEKFALPINDKFFPMALPVKRIIEIKPNSSDIIKVSGAQKLQLLQMHSYRYHFLQRMNLTNFYIKHLMQLATKVEILTRGRIKI